MIRYALTCDSGHTCDSWFQSAQAYERLREAGMLTCAECGSHAVRKALMAPRVATSQAGATPAAPLSTPADAREAALAELRRRIEEGSEYVGMSFATEARAIHEGEAPERAIWGEARPAEARALIEDGIAVAPLPFLPARKRN